MSIAALTQVLSPKLFQSVERLDFSLGTWERNPRIGGLLGKTVLSGGKRLRPLMTFMMADFFGIPHQKIEAYGRMIELVHASTLAHDDVVDNADLRRGEPSINAVASNKKAVLAGDYLLAYVLQEIAQSGRNDLVIEMASIIADLAEGEWLQIENSEKKDLSWQDIEKVALKKTGSVLRWCCAAPVLLAELDESFLKRARRLGEAIGIAFQLTDDILDFRRSDGSEGADLKNRVVNSVIFEALCLQQGTEVLDMSQTRLIEPEATLAAAISRVRLRVDQLVEEAQGLLHELADDLDRLRGLKDPAPRASLETLIHFLAQRI